MTGRIQEGALSARETPTQPPAQTKLVPLRDAVAPNGSSHQPPKQP